jgi:hypothetical protein
MDLTGNDVHSAERSIANRQRWRGNAAPACAFPPPFLRFRDSDRSRGIRVRMRSAFVGPSRHRRKQDLEAVLAAYVNPLVAQPENGFARVGSRSEVTSAHRLRATSRQQLSAC